MDIWRLLIILVGLALAFSACTVTIESGDVATLRSSGDEVTTDGVASINRP